jgi:hypothetical protein
MKAIYSLLIALCLVLLAGVARADGTTSFTGTLANSEDTFLTTFALTSTEDVTVQTWEFGGGTNAAGTKIAAGGFDPLIALFSGTGMGASMLTDGMGNPFGTSDVLNNYGGFAGCPPAGVVNIGSPTCGDITMTLALGPGTYTLLLSDADYIPNAIFDNGTLGEGFSDFTGGAFQTCNTDSSGALVCADDTANWAFDLTTKSRTVTASEPSTLASLALAMAALALTRRRIAGRQVS